MSRSAKIAGVALAAGILLATAIVIAVDDRPAEKATPRIATIGADPLRAELDRCRTLTMPDAGCEAAWEDHRRRFLGRDSGDRQFDTGTTMGSPADGLDREPSSDPADRKSFVSGQSVAVRVALGGRRTLKKKTN